MSPFSQKFHPLQPSRHTLKSVICQPIDMGFLAVLFRGRASQGLEDHRFWARGFTGLVTFRNPVVGVRDGLLVLEQQNFSKKK